ncbi:MAG TPA: helix-turn-helix domain-containing protein, partial [Solirubrobacteraceae bacterium]|nr:helix-turn-helix domain-containing protein [Solirubrobacteraceae bacterium]
MQAARELVTEHGYDAVSTSEIQRRARVSRGGLYHHFASRQELMAAVIEAIEVELAQRLAGAVKDAGTPFAELQVGVQWYLDECVRSKEIQRIGLYESRQALGWRLWRESVAPYGVAMLGAALEAAMDAGEINRLDAHALAYALLASRRSRKLRWRLAVVVGSEMGERESAPKAGVNLRHHPV